MTNRYYFQKDHLGSIIGLTNASGTLVGEYQYDVYGTAYARTGTGAFEKVSVGNLYDNNRLFTGREYDGEIGLYYLRARYYDASTGRFISRDPIGQVDDVNLYGYVQNNPLRFIDLMGLTKALIVIGQEKEYSFFGKKYPDSLLHKAARYQYQQLLDNGYKDKNIDIANYTDVHSQRDILQTNYGNVYIIAHANSNRIAVSDDISIDRNTISNIHPMCSAQKSITIIGCNSGNGSNSIASVIADRTGSKVIAPTGFEGVDDSGKTSVSFIKSTFPWVSTTPGMAEFYPHY
ncbi:MAG: RHS repeat-associated core domain-containing protein [Candidatus Gracilibacteria bacterium]